MDDMRDDRQLKPSDYVYIARQPIFMADRKVFGYELLYRDGSVNAFTGHVDGSKATSTVISEALLNFGMSTLTQGRHAFVNFTEELLMKKVPLLLKPNDFIIEILENVALTSSLLSKVAEMKGAGFQIALDDYCGDALPEAALELIDIIKLDFQLTDKRIRYQCGKYLRKAGKRILAEKVETQDEFEEAVRMGCTLFQGYYFAKPAILKTQLRDIASVSYIRLARELSLPDIRLDQLVQIVSSDAHLTYQLLKRVSTLQYYRGRVVSSVRQALVILGFDEIRRWGMLVLLRELVGKRADELVRTALVRALFCEELCWQTEQYNLCHNAFSTGLLSVIDWADCDEAKELPIADHVKAALLGTSGMLRRLLELVCSYESGDWYQVEFLTTGLPTPVSPGRLSKLYQKAVHTADLALSYDE